MGMNACLLHTSVSLIAAPLLVISSSNIYAQGDTNDPFLDAMLHDSAPTPVTETVTTAPDQAIKEEKPAATQTDQPDNAQHAVPTGRLIKTSTDTKLIGQEAVMRELGEATGLGIFNDATAYEGKKVTGVSIRYTKGKRTVPDQRLLDIIQTSPGSKYMSSRVNDDLERLLEKGLVGNNARVAVEPFGGGVRVVFEVEPAGVMGGVGFTGNYRYGSKKLREVTKLNSGRVINDHDLSLARSEIIKLYHDAGYPDVKVSWRHTSTARQGYQDVIFDIHEGREVRLQRIRFSGNKQFDSQQLRQMMKTKQRNIFHWIDDSGNIDREQLDDDMQEIIRHYRNYGYLRAAITKVDYFSGSDKSGPENLHMLVHINEGPRYRVRHVSFKGNSVYSAQQLQPGMSMLDGDIYSLQKVSDDSTMIRKYYGAKGYADADVRPDINEVAVEKDGTRVVDICYVISEGNSYRVGRINVRGNTKTKPYVILRELPLKSGQNFNSVDLETAKRRMENLGYFDGIDVSPAASPIPGYRDININVHERMTGSLTFGVAFSSVENVYLYANAVQSNFDIRGLFGHGSIVGGGQRLSVQGKLGFDYQSASISLTEPWFMDRKLELGNELYFSNSSYMSDYYTQINYGYAISLRRAIDDKRSVRLTYRIENYELGPQGFAPQFFWLSCRDYSRSNLGISYEYDTRDEMITPRKGGNVEVHASYSGPGSTVQTYSMGANASVYHNSVWDSIFSLNFGIETIDTLHEDDAVPIFERCYLGGPANLRGFRYRDVGMVNEFLAGDETMGGNSSAFVQAEVSIPLADMARLAFFVDAGFVHEDSFDFHLDDFCADYGIGLRLNLPIGPLAVDYAIPFKTANAIDRSGQFQFYANYKY